MSEENLNILYDETWRNYDKFTYRPFTGHSETKRVGKLLILIKRMEEKL